MMLTVLFLRSPTSLRAYGADDDKAHPAISVLYSVRVTLTNHYWVTSDERRRFPKFKSSKLIAVTSGQLVLPHLDVARRCRSISVSEYPTLLARCQAESGCALAILLARCNICVMDEEVLKKARIELARQGGKARAKSLSAEERKRIATKASKAAARARSLKAKRKPNNRKS